MPRDGIDKQVYAIWQVIHGDPSSPGPLFRSHFFLNDTVKHKELVAPPGAIDVTLQFNEGHWKSKRKEKDVAQIDPNVLDVPVTRDFNPSAFHFGKMKDDEVLLRFDHSWWFLRGDDDVYVKSIEPDGDEASPHAVAINVSPLAVGHSLILPWLAESRPQLLEFHALSVAVRFMAECSNRDSRILFNSLGGFSSVNHLHFHLVNMSGISPDKRTPIERAALIGPAWTNRKRPGATLHFIDTSVEAGWGCGAYVIQVPVDAPIDTITTAVEDVVAALYIASIPFHLLIATSKKIYVIPRQNQAVQERTAGLRQAAFEVVGVQVCLGPHQWENTTWAEFTDRLRTTVSLKPSQLAVIPPRAGWTTPGAKNILLETSSLQLAVALAVGAVIIGVLRYRQ